jgi:DNA-binding MarR family transcriptional regulator
VSRPAKTPAAALQLMPGHLIRRAQQLHNALFAEECGRLELTSVQFAALFAIRGAGEIDATRLAAEIGFDRATIGDVVDRLQTKGWIARSGDPADRRIKRIRLTPEGEQVLGEVEPAVARVQARMLEPFTPDERKVLMALLKRLDGLE